MLNGASLSGTQQGSGTSGSYLFIIDCRNAWLDFFELWKKIWNIRCNYCWFYQHLVVAALSSTVERVEAFWLNYPTIPADLAKVNMQTFSLAFSLLELFRESSWVWIIVEKYFLVNFLTFFGARLLPAVFLLFALSSSSLFSSRLLLFFRAWNFCYEELRWFCLP